MQIKLATHGPQVGGPDIRDSDKQ